jgi:hypothetical protein
MANDAAATGGTGTRIAAIVASHKLWLALNHIALRINTYRVNI